MTGSIYIFFGLLLILSLGGCREKIGTNKVSAEEAGFEIAGTNQRIVVKRSRSHETLPEYSRVVELWIVNQRKTAYEMFPDTGGTVKIEIRRDESAVYLSDRISTYKVDLGSSKIIEQDKAGGALLGVIDAVEGGGWKFIEAYNE